MSHDIKPYRVATVGEQTIVTVSEIIRYEFDNTKPTHRAQCTKLLSALDRAFEHGKRVQQGAIRLSLGIP